MRFFSGLPTVALIVFAWLALAVPLGQTLLFDIAVRDHIHDWASPPLTAVMLSVTEMGEPLFLAIVTLSIAWPLAVKGGKRQVLKLAVATLTALLADELLKLLFHRIRPAAFFGYLEPASYSFPSGHAMLSTCYYGLLAAILAARIQARAGRAVLWAAGVILVAAIGFSRLYLGVHYATDVIAGYALGIVWIAGAGRVSF